MRETFLTTILVFILSSYGETIHAKETQIVESFHILSDIRFRFATTQIVSVVRNIGGKAQEMTFHATLPKQAFIVSFAMTIDGKVYEGEVKEKTEAKAQYQQAVNQGQSAGHIKQSARHSNVFDVSVNVANGSAVNFTLTYQELLTRKLGVYEHEIHVNPGMPVDDLLIDVNIVENTPLKFVRTPAMRKDLLINNKVEDENQLTIVDRPTPESANILFEPSQSEQGENGLAAKFVVQYDVEHSKDGDVLMSDGYFIHFYAPDFPPMKKDILFVLDVSGSMSGSKIEQLKSAMYTILDDLKSFDKFNIITFSTEAYKWKEGMISADKDNVAAAKSFVENIQASGGTNINSALKMALHQFNSRQRTRVPMVFFLTDGQPTSGVTDHVTINRNALEANIHNATIYGLAFGAGADYDSLKVLTAQNKGFARKIYEASDASLQVSSLYEEISAVVATDLKVTYLPDAVDEFTVTKTEHPIVFNGSEIVICGPFFSPRNEFSVKVSSVSNEGKIEVDLDSEDVNVIELETEEKTSDLYTGPRDFRSIVERMWAYTTIRQLLKEKEKAEGNAEKVKTLKEKIISLSIRYNFVTPLTSMVVTKPDSDKRVETSLEDSDELSPTQYGPIARSGKRFRYKASRAKSHVAHHMPVHDTGSSHGLPGLPPMVPNLAYNTVIRPAQRFTTTTRRPYSVATSPRPRPNKPKKPSKELKSYIGSITGITRDESICIAMKKVSPATYQIVNDKNVSIELTTGCNNKKCKFPSLKKLTIISASGKAVIYPLRRGKWVTSNGAAFKVSYPNRNSIELEINGFKVKAEKKPIKKKAFMFFTIQTLEGRKSTSLFGKLFSMKQAKKTRMQKKKPHHMCKASGATISLMIKGKFAKKVAI